jgi:alginate O-acetyltransferase complex protein AlgI
MIQKGHDSGLDLRARTFLIIAVIANLCLLCYFKYANFLVDSLDFILNAVRLNWLEVRLSPVHLPIGISFFTFHSLSYVIDVYRKVVTAQRNLVNMALYPGFPISTRSDLIFALL